MKEFQSKKSKINIEKSIESLYILKHIFTFLSEKQELNLIICCKHLQKKLNISIEDYKRIIGIYKEDGRNGKGKEYHISTNTMIFEGDYLNGKRNGKGKEYSYYGKFKYEGEYLNGKRNGKGKEYYFNGELKFEGQYLKGLRWNGKGYKKGGNIDYEIKEGNGKGKEYYDNDKLKFEGEYLKGKRNGKGNEYDDYHNELRFEGEYLNGEKNGKGIEFFHDELVFEGEYSYGRRWNGKGNTKEGNINYEIIEGNGNGKEYDYDSKLVFEGEYLKGIRWKGKVKEYDYNDKLIFEGEYLNGKKKWKRK